MKIFDVIQGTPEWLEIRKATITGSRAKALKAMPLDPAKTAKIDWKSHKTRPPAFVTLMSEMIAEDLAPLPESYKSDAMERGNLFEPLARADYEKITGEKVVEIGFCIHETRNYLGLSPDGFVEPKKEGDPYIKAIEIKCPGPKNHVKILISNKIPEAYNEQIVHYFLVNEDLQELDFISHNPDMYVEHLRTHIISVKRSDYAVEIEETLQKLDIFAEVWEANIKSLTSKKNEKEKNIKKDKKEDTKA